MYPMLNQEMIKVAVGGQAVSGVLLCSSYSTQLTKNNSEYIIGTLQSGVNLPFKAWGNSKAFEVFKSTDLSGTPVYVTGKWDNYGGSISLVVETVQKNDEYTPDQFFPIKYNIDAYWEGLKKVVYGRVSEKGKTLANQVLFENEALASKFKYEFAAMKHHDNCKGGLLAHTYKVVNAMIYITTNYSRLCSDDGVVNQDMLDILILGALFHDIGKVTEMKFGVYQPESIVTHRYLGIEFLYPFKDYIVENYSSEWWYNLVSIFLQHHGEFEDDCRTLPALLVHKADMIDSEMTNLCQLLDTPFTESTGNVIKVNGKRINI